MKFMKLLERREMKRTELLDKAKEIITGAREEHYGSPEDNFRNIAMLWTAYLDDGGISTVIHPEDVAIMMILMKCARLKSDERHEDSWIDIAGYASCGSEIVNG